MDRELWEKAERALYQKFGRDLPVAVASRFASERAAFGRGDQIVGWDLAGTLRAGLGKRALTARGESCGTLTAWLLRAAELDPMPSHDSSPRWGRGEGSPQGGHGISMDWVAAAARTPFCLELEIAQGLLDKAEGLLGQYFAPDRRLLRAPDPLPGLRRYTIAAPDGETGPTVLFYETQTQTDLFRLPPSRAETPELGETEGRAFIRFLAQKEHLKAPGLLRYAEEHGVDLSTAVQLYALEHSTGGWAGNGEELVRSGAAELRELPATRDDLFRAVRQRLLAAGITETGLAVDAVRYVLAAGEKRERVGALLLPALEKIGMPAWALSYMGKTRHLFSRYHCVTVLAHELALFRHATGEGTVLRG